MFLQKPSEGIFEFICLLSERLYVTDRSQISHLLEFLFIRRTRWLFLDLSFFMDADCRLPGVVTYLMLFFEKWLVLLNKSLIRFENVAKRYPSINEMTEILESSENRSFQAVISSRSFHISIWVVLRLSRSLWSAAQSHLKLQCKGNHRKVFQELKWAEKYFLHCQTKDKLRTIWTSLIQLSYSCYELCSIKIL